MHETDAIAYLDELAQIDRARILHPASNVASFAHDISAKPEIITSAEGVRIRDSSGRVFLDGFAGLYCVNIGYGRQVVAEAIARQARELAYYHSYAGHSTVELIELTDRLVSMAPNRMTRVFYGLSGSDANETQVKLAWYYNNVLGRPEKKKIISRQRGYHGCSIMSGSLTGLSFYHTGFDLPLEIVRHTGAPYYYRDAEAGETEEAFSRRRATELETLILDEGPDTVAAFIAEPALGTGGLVPAPRGYWPQIQEVLRRYDVLLIADEVITGFGRTGQMFGSDTYDIQPDLITLAKGLTSAYVPMSAVLIGERVNEALEHGSERYGIFSHGYTYSGHPLAAAAANAVIDIVVAENLPANARSMGEHLVGQLEDSLKECPIVGDIRGVGLMVAVELVADRSTREGFDPAQRVAPRVAQGAREAGLIVRAMPQSDIIGFAPPLIISRQDVELMAEITAHAITRVAAELGRQ